MFGPVNLVDINLLAANDQKIQAIQKLCQESGLGLTGAKMLVDALLDGDNQTALSIMKAGVNSSSTGHQLSL